MTNVLGFRLEAAAETLRQEGFTVEFREVRSRKGVSDGDDSRVVGQTVTEPGRVTLMYAVFRTKPGEANA